MYEEDGKIKAYVGVNGKNGVSAKGRVYLYNVLTGEENTLAEFDEKFSVGSTCAATAEKSKIPQIEQNENIVLCDLESDICSDRSFYCPNYFKNVPWGKNDAFVLTETDGGCEITADTCIPYVMLDTDSKLSDNCFFLKKGETVTLKIGKQ